MQYCTGGGRRYMFNINFKDRYKVVHVNNELGDYVVGGAGTYMNEIYRFRTPDMGFVYINNGDVFENYATRGFLEQKDILIMHRDETYKLAEIQCDLIVIQFYEFAYLVTDELKRNKKIAYVIHSVPTPEPPPVDDPFGGNYDVKDKFERLCQHADVLVCVSNAEKDKLIKMYPQYREKTYVVYNGMSYDRRNRKNENYKNSRKIFGYIGRMDYRKGILECIKEFKDIDGELRIACPKNDDGYALQITNYIEAAGMTDRVKFYGWCVGKRKENFLNSLDCLVIPSLYEPFGYVALEGMQYGIPIISSNNGGLNEILSGYKYKYNPYERGQLGKMILEFQQDSEKVIGEQQRILSRNLERFTAQGMAEEYIKLWDRVME